MLLSLAIQDFVIVDRLELEFAKGFGALTGETGAGKSILIDALALVLGERADPGVVREGKERAEVSAVFGLDDLPRIRPWMVAQEFGEADELILRRVIEKTGRSRAYLNGSAVTLQQLREAGEFLVDIHGQHAHQSLLRADAQRALLDAHGNLAALAREVALAWKEWRDLETALAHASTHQEANAHEREMLEWQLRELEQLEFSSAGWEALEAEQRRLQHAAGLIEGAEFALDLLAEREGAAEILAGQAGNRITEMAALDPELSGIADMLHSVQAEFSEIISTLRRYVDRIELDPERLREVDARINAVLTLSHKYRVEPAALDGLKETWQARLSSLAAAADLDALREKTRAAGAAYAQKAAALSEKRAAAASKLGKAVSAGMRELALGSGHFEVALLPIPEGSAHGQEQVEFRIAGLAQNEARPLARVASGGELSRISLALQVVTSRNASVPTLIFDEVDVGIGGGVAEIVGRLLHQLGEERQVLCVTHLPQVAARADWHWQVRKEIRKTGVTSRVEALDPNARIEEIARMLGGIDITTTTREHAREMLAGNSRQQTLPI
ncbi:MAG: DNA repair protein RecN [Zoogloeaceae bacterium]|nr:DNA repair protein RecN [Zoogloeaceae bacterium]